MATAAMTFFQILLTQGWTRQWLRSEGSWRWALLLRVTQRSIIHHKLKSSSGNVPFCVCWFPGGFPELTGCFHDLYSRARRFGPQGSERSRGLCIRAREERWSSPGGRPEAWGGSSSCGLWNDSLSCFWVGCWAALDYHHPMESLKLT